MGNISNSVLNEEIDFIAAVAKAMANIYTATYDGYDFMVKEDNPDDLTNGVDAAIAVRTRLDGGTGVYSQFSNLTSWLAVRASDASVTGVDGLLTARHQRAPYSYDQYVHYPSNGSHLSTVNIFYDTEIELGNFVYGGTFSSVGDLTMSGSHNWTVLEVQNAGGISSPWVLGTTVNYGDGTTGTEETVFAGTESQYDTANINNNPINGVSEAGTYQVTLEAGTTGMVAGQYVLLVDNSYPALFASGVATGATEFSVDPAQLGWYINGDPITLSDNAGNTEVGHIAERINFQYGIVWLATATAKAYTTANSGYMCKTTPAGDGFQEAQAIASITGTDLVFSGALQHTYSTGGYAHRLIRKVLTTSTTSGGGADFEVTFQTKSERTVDQIART
jgi:hypothetical protein